MIKIYRFKNKNIALEKIYQKVKDIIIKNNQKCALGLASGATFQETYKLLSNDKDINWRGVSTFNLDEYYCEEKNELGKYYSYMFQYMNDVLFKNTNIDYKNVYFPEYKIENYDENIKEKGGIKIQLLGIGRNGHIGFNEPYSKIDSVNRIVKLTKTTITDNGKAFFNGEINRVPKKAVTMGVKTILLADKIIVAAFGEHKAEVMTKFIKNNEINEKYPITFIKKHNNVEFFVDYNSLPNVDELDSKIINLIDVE